VKIIHINVSWQHHATDHKKQQGGQRSRDRNSNYPGGSYLQ
jgi:hypothetical protein